MRRLSLWDGLALAELAQLGERLGNSAHCLRDGACANDAAFVPHQSARFRLGGKTVGPQQSVAAVALALQVVFEIQSKQPTDGLHVTERFVEHVAPRLYWFWRSLHRRAFLAAAARISSAMSNRSCGSGDGHRRQLARAVQEKSAWAVAAFAPPPPAAVSEFRTPPLPGAAPLALAEPAAQRTNPRCY